MGAKKLIELAALVSLTVLWGCGSSMDSSGDGTGGDDLRDQIAAAGFVGADRCIDCHQGFSWSVEAVQKYLESKHVIHSTSINAKSDAACLKCHDPIGDGPFVEPFINSNDVPEEGLAAVTCEVCHGSGIDHYGIGPMPHPIPDYEVCGDCHNDLPDSHIPFHPLADSILDNFKRGAHYLVDPDTGDNDARDGAPCFRCHSDEGYRDYIGITVGLDGEQLDKKLNGIADLPVATTIQCRTCHDPHSGDLRANETTERITVNETILEPRPVSFSRQFNLCTSCHQVFLDATPVIATDPDAEPGEKESFEYFNYTLDYDPENTDGTPFHGTDGDPTSDSNSRLIWDTHFSDPETGIVGYNINAADEKACTQCHDPHAGSKFEQSFAGGIAEAWGNTEYFHGDYQNFPTRDSQSCARCHSGTEHIKWINGLEDWDLSSGEARVIACVTCHDLTVVNDSGDGFELGALRDYVREEIFFPPFPTEENADTFLPIDPVRLGLDTTTIGSDAFCIGCHLGRGGKGELDEEIAKITGTDESISRNDNHHGYAAATRYGNMAKGGYEYDERANADGQYSYSSKFEHVTAYDDCNECHSIHTGKVKIEDCGDCHLASDNMPVENETDLWDIRMPGSSADYDGDGDTTEGVYYEIQGLWNILQGQLDVLLGTPTDDDDAGSFNIPGTSTNYERLAKAQYNLNYADMFGENFRDNGAYAHNPAYVIELLYDSLDDLDDGLQNDSVAEAESLGIARDDAGHFDAAAEAFRHWDLIYNENDQEFEDGFVSPRCNKCHSSEGSAYFLKNDMVKGTYDRQDTKGISAGLACEACHFPSVDVGLPVGEAIVPDAVTFPSGAVQDLNNTSNICMTCHQGRESGQSVDDVIENNPAGPYSFINIHYFPAAATFFGSGVNGGYEYAGKSYAGQFDHNFGPPDCEACHVNRAPQHNFILVTPTTSCGCHGNPLNDFTIIRFPSPGVDYDGDGNATEGIYGEIWDTTDQESTHPADENSIVGNLFVAIENYALNVIGEAIQYDPGSYPYYFKEGAISFGNRYDQFDASLLKAAYNYQMIQKDPCGYIHNAEYHLQLLIDSIEDLGGDISKYTRP
jgi:hypothetical protein